MSEKKITVWCRNSYKIVIFCSSTYGDKFKRLFKVVLKGLLRESPSCERHGNIYGNLRGTPTIVLSAKNAKAGVTERNIRTYMLNAEFVGVFVTLWVKKIS